MQIYVKSNQGINLPVYKLYINLILDDIEEIAASTPLGRKSSYIFKYIQPRSNISKHTQPTWEQLETYDQLIAACIDEIQNTPQSQKYQLEHKQSGTTYSYYLYFTLQAVRTIQVIIRISSHSRNKLKTNKIQTLQISYSNLMNSSNSFDIYIKQFKSLFLELDNNVIQTLKNTRQGSCI